MQLRLSQMCFFVALGGLFTQAGHYSQSARTAMSGKSDPDTLLIPAVCVKLPWEIKEEEKKKKIRVIHTDNALLFFFNSRKKK